jgi:hypothetical protein
MSTIILKSDPGIKRDGTKFEGNAYVDGQWVRWQRGLPRKIGGFRSTTKYLPEKSTGLTNINKGDFVYMHSGSATELNRLTIDASYNSSIITSRTPIAVVSTGSVTLTGGAAGVVSMITVNGVDIMSAPVTYVTSLSATATAVAANITAYTSFPNYDATAVGAIITITSTNAGSIYNGYVVVATTTTITTTKVDMSGGSEALIEDSDNKWMFDYQYDSSTTANSILAHCAPNNSYATNDTVGQIFYGDAFGTVPLKDIRLPTGANVAGGIVSLHPYLFYYGGDGIVGWSVAGDFTDLSGSGSGIARPWGTKIIKGMPLRAGSGNAPAGLFWAYDAVIRTTFTGGATVFQFDVIATGTSIISPDSVVDYDGIYYWVGVDRFMMFNGVVREVANLMNLNYFFEGINQNERQKVFGFKVPRFGEIWWCYPRGDATECTHAVIYNVREQTWYDTQLPNAGRSSATYSNLFVAPIAAGLDAVNNDFHVWIHEKGVNQIYENTLQPIYSFFETADLSSPAQGNSNWHEISIIEPDFVQSSDMTVQVIGRSNARAPEVYGNIYAFPDTAEATYQQIVTLKEQRRELRLRFESNAIDGDYQMGQIIAHIDVGDGTVTG